MSVTQSPLIAEMGCKIHRWLGLKQKQVAAKLEVSAQSVNRSKNIRTKLQIVLKLIEGMVRSISARAHDLLVKHFANLV